MIRLSGKGGASLPDRARTRIDTIKTITPDTGIILSIIRPLGGSNGQRRHQGGDSVSQKAKGLHPETEAFHAGG